MQQQTLGAWPDPSSRLETFEPGPNGSAMHAIEAGQSALVHGPQGSGKTHLARVSVELHGGFYLDLAITSLTPQVLEGLESFAYLVLDGIDQVIGQLAWEESLFGLWNACLDSGTQVHAFSSFPVNEMHFVIPDLRSRLAQLPAYSLKSLDEEALVSLLERRSETLNIRLPEEVVVYLLRHHDRSTASVVRLFERIAQASLEDQRPVTVPYVSSLLKRDSSET